MGIYDRYVLPRLVTCCCGTKPVLKQRAKVVPKVHGRVLEIGMGAGHNLPYYDFNQVDHVVGLDPCETSWKLAQPRVRSVPLMSNLWQVRQKRYRSMMRALTRSC